MLQAGMRVNHAYESFGRPFRKRDVKHNCGATEDSLAPRGESNGMARHVSAKRASTALQLSQGRLLRLFQLPPLAPFAFCSAILPPAAWGGSLRQAPVSRAGGPRSRTSGRSIPPTSPSSSPRPPTARAAMPRCSRAPGPAPGQGGMRRRGVALLRRPSAGPPRQHSLARLQREDAWESGTARTASLDSRRSITKSPIWAPTPRYKPR